jgi:hypothetical protein
MFKKSEFLVPPLQNRNLGKSRKVVSSPLNQKNELLEVPNVFLMASDSFDNVMFGFAYDRWGCKTCDASYNDVKIGDFVVIYVSGSEPNETRRKQVHLIGRVKSKSDPSFLDYTTWGVDEDGRPACCITEMEWMNKPSPTKTFSLNEMQELVPFNKWRHCLQSGGWTPISGKSKGSGIEIGWDYDSPAFITMLSKLQYGFNKSECVSVPKEYITKLNELNIPYLV